MRELILQGTFGKLQSVHYHDGIEFDWPAASPNHFRPDVRGTWSDTGVHLLDTIVYWLGGESMELVSSLNDAAGGPEALATVQLRKDNCDIEIKVSRLGRLMNSFRIVGTEATLESDAEGWSDLTLNHRNGRTQRINCTGKQKYAKYTDFAHPLIDNFVECIRGTATPVVSGRSVLPVIQLLEEAYEKAQRYPMPWDAHWESCYV
ncbi:MAG: Gfo/Idh/MocA family oxidoreductase [Planctomycetota bacterium]